MKYKHNLLPKKIKKKKKRNTSTTQRKNEREREEPSPRQEMDGTRVPQFRFIYVLGFCSDYFKALEVFITLN